MKLLERILQPKRESLISNIEKLARRKLTSFNAIELCDMFIERGADKVKADAIPLFSQDKLSINADQELIDYSYLEMAGMGISDEFAELGSDLWGLSPEERKVCIYLRHQLFIGLIAEIEDFISTLLLLILNAYPERLPEVELPLRNIKFKELNNLSSLEEIIRTLGLSSEELLANTITNKVNIHVKDMLYGSSYEYAKKIRSYLQVDDDFLREEWLYYCEMCTRRNAGIHAGWKMTRDYNQLIEKINKNSRLNLTITNQDFLGFNGEYFDKALGIASEIVRRIEIHCISHFSALIAKVEVKIAN